MQQDFHYYATYCAASLAGYSHEQSLAIAYSAQLTDLCSATLLKKLKAPRAAATTQLQLELMDARTDPVSLQNITRIWASFHFLPGDLQAGPEKKCSQRYLNKYRLICNPNGDLLEDTVRLAKGGSLQAAGIAMHVLADTWAHRYFAGTPSLVINNTNGDFYELVPDGNGTEAYAPGPDATDHPDLSDQRIRCRERQIDFRHNPSAEDDPEEGAYINSIYQSNENNIMNLGHGRAGHLPDYSFMRYRYLPAWGDYREVTKDNPSDYMHAFCQMVFALRYLRGDTPDFAKNIYDFEAVRPWGREISWILQKRQLDASEDWRALGREITGCEVEDFDLDKYQDQYTEAEKDKKEETFLGRFFQAAIAQKSMVTDRIFSSGNMLAGISVDPGQGAASALREMRRQLRRREGGRSND